MPVSKSKRKVKGKPSKPQRKTNLEYFLQIKRNCEQTLDSSYKLLSSTSSAVDLLQAKTDALDEQDKQDLKADNSERLSQCKIAIKNSVEDLNSAESTLKAIIDEADVIIAKQKNIQTLDAVQLVAKLDDWGNEFVYKHHVNINAIKQMVEEIEQTFKS